MFRQHSSFAGRILKLENERRMHLNDLLEYLADKIYLTFFLVHALYVPESHRFCLLHVYAWLILFYKYRERFQPMTKVLSTPRPFDVHVHCNIIMWNIVF